MPPNPRVKRHKLLEAARGYLLLDMPDHALEQLDAIGGGHLPFAVNQLRGECLRQKQDYPAALGAYRRAHAQKPDDLPVLMGMAWCFKRVHRLDEAITAMEQANRLSPNEPIIMYNLACYFALAGNKTQALSWLGRALRSEKSLRKLIPDESDFDALRNDPDFQFVIGARKVSDV
jgi:tetratricopeptide (TPR) repeat protein